tara:strand:- start:42 stop:527 length:486 start_codon:yes stop_codon:yes gene_type:complete
MIYISRSPKSRYLFFGLVLGIELGVLTGLFIKNLGSEPIIESGINLYILYMTLFISSLTIIYILTSILHIKIQIKNDTLSIIKRGNIYNIKLSTINSFRVYNSKKELSKMKPVKSYIKISTLGIKSGVIITSKHGDKNNIYVVSVDAPKKIESFVEEKLNL